jgi:hypothetical protein
MTFTEAAGLLGVSKSQLTANIYRIGFDVHRDNPKNGTRYIPRAQVEAYWKGGVEGLRAVKRRMKQDLAKI